MLRSLYGQVLQVQEDVVVLEASGLGFEIQCSRRAAESCVEGDMARVQTFLLVNESGISIFGFADDEERRLFLELLAVKGVGGRMAMTLLRADAPQVLIKAILSSDMAMLTRIPGIGRKTAERLCFELKDRLSKDFPILSGALAGSFQQLGGNEVIEALLGLGFSRSEASGAVRSALVQAGEGAREE